MRVLDNKYNIGEIVYLKTDEDQKERIVFAFIVYENEILYRLAAGTSNSEHYEFEISKEKDYVQK